MYKVKNIDKTTQVLYDKGGRRVEILPGKSSLMICPPEDSYTFHTEKHEKKEKPKIVKKEVKE